MNLRHQLRERGLEPRKSYGQNFLVSTNAIRGIIQGARIQPDEHILEIGPGIGALSEHLATMGASYSAIEADPRMAAALQSAPWAQSDRVQIIQADALEYAFDQLPQPLGVVANLPYNISSQIMFRLLDQAPRIRHFTLMFQREMAERILAQPGSRDYGPLAIATQMLAQVRPLIRSLPPGAFHPRPKVHSTVIRGIMRPEPLFPIDSVANFRAFVRLIFAHRRKTLRNNLRGTTPWGPIAESALEQAAINPGRRAESLHIAEIHQLYTELDRILPRKEPPCAN